MVTFESATNGTSELGEGVQLNAPTTNLSRAVSPVPMGFLVEEVTPDSTLLIDIRRCLPHLIHCG